MKGSTTLPTPLVATLSLAWTGQALDRSKIENFARSPETERYFANCYRCAFDFIFNESFPLHTKQIDGYSETARSGLLGTAVFKPNAALGSCQCDAVSFLFDDEDGIPTQLLQIHLRFRKATQSIDHEFLEAYCQYIENFTSPDEDLVKQGEADDPALALWIMALRNRRTGRFRTTVDRRRYALPHSYFVTASAFGVDKQAFETRETFKQPIYSLLYRHPNGAGDGNETSKGAGWSSTCFFEAWFEPGAAVVLSTGFPEDRYAGNEALSASFFDALFSGNGDDAANILQDEAFRNTIPKINADRNAYDLLPEYPPLRYVAPVAVLYGLLYEEVLRDTYERLLALSSAPSFNPFIRFARFIVDGREIRALTRRLARIDTLEHLRLPVSRPLGDLIITSKLQNRVEKAVQQLVANRLALVGQALAIAGTVLAVIGTIAGIMSLID